jgi:hypothetical protein
LCAKILSLAGSKILSLAGKGPKAHFPTVGGARTSATRASEMSFFLKIHFRKKPPQIQVSRSFQNFFLEFGGFLADGKCHPSGHLEILASRHVRLPRQWAVNDFVIPSDFVAGNGPTSSR